MLARPPGVVLLSVPDAVSSHTSLILEAGVADLDPVYVDRMRFTVVAQGNSNSLSSCFPAEVPTGGVASVIRNCAGIAEGVHR